MTSSFSLVVLCPNGRRETVKVTPNNSLLQVLEEACRKQKLDPEKHELRHYNRILDPSLPVRFSNLPNNAFVEMRATEGCRTDQLVTVALQLESGERITADFPPLTSIHDILERSLKSESICLEEIGEPVCIYMRQKIAGDAIKQTTLRNLGLTSGKAIIRLLYRKPEDLDVQAHVASPLVPQSRTDSWTSPGAGFSQHPAPPGVPPPAPDPDRIVPDHTAPREGSRSLLEAVEQSQMDVDGGEQEEGPTVAVKAGQSTRKPVKRPMEEEKREEEVVSQSRMECDAPEESEMVEDIGEINYIGGRHAVLYNLDEVTDMKKADLPDDFFDLTIGDAKYLMEEYRKQRAEWENQPLLTNEQRQRQLLQKFAQFSRTVIRVYFPERLVLQAVFTVTETVQDVKDFVRNYLDDRDLNFYLYMTPPKEVLNPHKSLVESMLAPAAVIHFGSDIRLPHYLMPSLRNKLSDPRAAALAASQSRESNNSSFTPEEIVPESVNNLVKDEKLENSSNTNAHPAALFTQSQGKVPKWLKLSKK